MSMDLFPHERKAIIDWINREYPRGCPDCGAPIGDPRLIKLAGGQEPIKTIHLHCPGCGRVMLLDFETMFGGE